MIRAVGENRRNASTYGGQVKGDLLISDDAAQTVYHAACAVELATDILVDLFTFLSPPVPYSRLFVLTAHDATPSQQTPVERE